VVTPKKRACVAGLLLTAALALAPLAAGNGDPASDVLYTQNVYLPYAAPTTSTARALKRVVSSVYSRHFRLKVALIASEVDLGNVTSLWGKPNQYANFLGVELESFYVGPLLVVMPAGFGIYDGGRAVTPEERVLASAAVKGSDSESLTLTATEVVTRLLRAGALRSKDIRAPFANAFSVTVKRGGTARLTFGVSDDSDWSKIVAQVLLGSRPIVTRKTALLRLGPQPVSLRWKVPRKLPKHGVRICVVASDAAGNRSARNCSAVAVV
jgi:hypothetical protein